MKRIVFLLLLFLLLFLSSCSDGVIWESFEFEGTLRDDHESYDEILFPHSGYWEIKVYYKEEADLRFNKDYMISMSSRFHEIEDVERNLTESYYTIPRQYFYTKSFFIELMDEHFEVQEYEEVKVHYKLIAVNM